MAQVSQFVFFDTTSTSTTSNSFGNAPEGNALTLQVDDFGLGATLNLKVEGAVDMNSPNSYFPIKVINLENFKTVNTITKAGIYMVVVSGIAFIRLTSNQSVGNFKAYAVDVS